MCEEHHFACEMTTISVEQVREACGIRKAVIPSHLYDDQVYDKSGNLVMANGTRLKGAELFFDESVQKVLTAGGVLADSSDRIKYPRSHHAPWSEGMHGDDRRIAGMDAFVGKRVIVTEKKDGENTTLTQTACMPAPLLAGTTTAATGSKAWSGPGSPASAARLVRVR